MHPTKFLPATIVAFALVLGLAACGGSSSPSSEKSTTTKVDSGGSDDEATTTEGDDPTTTTDSGDDASTTVVATGGGEFCENLATYINDSSMAEVDSTDPEGYKQAIEESTKQGKEILSQAPDELGDSIDLILEAQDQLIAELEKVDYDVTKIDPSAFDSMDSPELEAAGKELDAYVTDTCGIELPEATAETIPDMTTMTIPN